MPWETLSVLLGRNLNIINNCMVMHTCILLHKHVHKYHDDIAALEG